MKKVIEYFNHPLLKIPLLVGLITGVIGFIYFLALYNLGISPLGNHKSLDFGVHVIAMAATTWYYRKYVNKGMLHLWEGLSICYLINTIGALMTGWLIYFFVTQVDPMVFQQYLDNSRNLLLEGQKSISKELGADQFKTLLANISRIQPGDLIYDELFKKSALAVLPALVISLVFRKQDYSILE
jgi:hypothetical protein